MSRARETGPGQWEHLFAYATALLESPLPQVRMGGVHSIERVCWFRPSLKPGAAAVLELVAATDEDLWVRTAAGAIRERLKSGVWDK